MAWNGCISQCARDFRRLEKGNCKAEGKARDCSGPLINQHRSGLGFYLHTDTCMSETYTINIPDSYSTLLFFSLLHLLLPLVNYST